MHVSREAYLFSTAFCAVPTALPAFATALSAAFSAASAWAVASLPVEALTSVEAVFSTAVSFAALLSALFLLHAARPSARTATVTIATFFMNLSPFKSAPGNRQRPGLPVRVVQARPAEIAIIPIVAQGI